MGSDRIIIVDENNVPIGVKRRDEVDYSVDIYRSTGIWITNSKGQILIAQRSLMKKNNPGVWGPAAAGTIDEGETYESNAYKELEEEIGLTGVKLELLDVTFFQQPRKQFMAWFRGVCDVDIDDLRLRAEEVSGVKWIEPDMLVAEVKNNPENYLMTFPQILDFFGLS